MGYAHKALCKENRQSKILYGYRFGASVTNSWQVFGTNAVTSVVFDPSNAHLLYASSGNQAFKFDIRSTNVLVNTAIADLSVGEYLRSSSNWSKRVFF